MVITSYKIWRWYFNRSVILKLPFWLSLSATAGVLQGAFVYNAAKPYYIFPNTSSGVYIIATHKKFIQRHGFARVRKYSKATHLIVKSKYFVPTTAYLLFHPLNPPQSQVTNSCTSGGSKGGARGARPSPPLYV